MQLEQLKYPLGKFDYFKELGPTDLAEGIAVIEAFPARLSALAARLTDGQWETSYRADGWTARQVVHHLADSHSNALIRFKLALTEDNPTIKPYRENLWADLPDSVNAPVEWSLQILDALHARWTLLLRNMSEADFDRTYFHPDSQRTFPLRQVVSLYAWHCNHHYAHVEAVTV